MKESEPPHSAVIMGDLVRSESSLPIEQLHEIFNTAIEEQSNQYAQAILSPLTITLGDEFQGIVCSLKKAVSIARDLRLQLMDDGIDCRFVIGLAKIRTPINFEKAWNMMGPGLSRAREILDEKKPGQFYQFSISGEPVLEQMLDALGAGLSSIERDWTDQQRNDISAQIRGLGPKELAKKRNVSVHSIYKVRSSGKYDTYLLQWHAILAALAAIDEQIGLMRWS